MKKLSYYFSIFIYNSDDKFSIVDAFHPVNAFAIYE